MKAIKFILILFAVFILASCGGAEKKMTRDNFILNTHVSITVFSENPESDIEEVFDLCGRYEKLFSKTMEGSDIYNINIAAENVFTPVSAETVFLIEKSIEYSELTGGRFDITVGALTSLWDFQDSDNPVLPDKEKIDLAVKTVGTDNIIIKDNEIALKNSCKLDLGGIAKGYIADKIAEMFREKGISGIINLGGNVLTVGEKPDKTPYLIGVQKPFSSGEIAGGIKIYEKSVVTSGNYERFFYYGGKLYHHILDPKTGYPADTGFNSVTIISDNSMEGDAYSTGVFLMPPDDGISFVESLPETEGIFFLSNGDVKYTSGINTVIPFEEIID